MKFHAKLKTLCGRKNWNQADLCRALSGVVSESIVSDWFKAKRRPTMDVALMVAKALNVSLDYLADDNMDEPVIDTNAEEAEILAIVRRLGYELASDRLLQKENVIKHARVLTPEESRVRRGE